MNTENHILDILQLHEYGMAIGQSLEYKKSCDLFLKILLKRKNLNAAWILEDIKDTLLTTYAIPQGNEVSKVYTSQLKEVLSNMDDHLLVSDISIIQNAAPFSIDNGSVAIFNLKKQGFLFLYSKKNNISSIDLSQLQPVINKFCVNLQACKAFEEQENLLKNLASQNQELSDYAHMVSHDLKSPLRSIEALLNWLKEDYQEALGKKGSEEIDFIGSHLEKMDNLISGILSYSSIDKDLRKEREIDLNVLLDEVVNLQAVPSNVEVIIKKLPTIVADKVKIQQLFQNLVGNAISSMDKPEGKVTVSCEIVARAPRFKIADNGKGINKAYFEKIFQIFQKLDSNTSGTGIGLSIVKKIVSFYGGKIWLESEEGVGTTFYFTLPHTT